MLTDDDASAHALFPSLFVLKWQWHLKRKVLLRLVVKSFNYARRHTFLNSRADPLTTGEQNLFDAKEENARKGKYCLLLLAVTVCSVYKQERVYRTGWGGVAKVAVAAREGLAREPSSPVHKGRRSSCQMDLVCTSTKVTLFSVTPAARASVFGLRRGCHDAPLSGDVDVLPDRDDAGWSSTIFQRQCLTRGGLTVASHDPPRVRGLCFEIVAPYANCTRGCARCHST